MADSCTADDHAALREWIQLSRLMGEAVDGILPAYVKGWFETMRPWPDAGLLLGECVDCHSTIAVCAEHVVPCEHDVDDLDMSEAA